MYLSLNRLSLNLSIFFKYIIFKENLNSLLTHLWTFTTADKCIIIIIKYYEVLFTSSKKIYKLYIQVNINYTFYELEKKNAIIITIC